MGSGDRHRVDGEHHRAEDAHLNQQYRKWRLAEEQDEQAENGDGRLDYIVANQWEDSIFFRNVANNPENAFLGLHLLLPTKAHPRTQSSVLRGQPQSPILGYPAIGALVTLHLENGKTVVSQVDGGNGHSGSRSKSIHFGLGVRSSSKPIELEVMWRTSSGKLMQEKFAVEPGWSTILLGNNA